MQFFGFATKFQHYLITGNAPVSKIDKDLYLCVHILLGENVK